MSDIDWPLAITLAVIFVVMSVVRWRYFTSASRRWNRRPGADEGSAPGATRSRSDEPGAGAG